MKNIAIIGAGLSAPTLATILKSSANISVFEKSRSVSGRMSTRRAGLYHFDHGAQFFRAKSPGFKAFIHPMIEQGIIGPWDARLIELDKTKIVAKRNWGMASPHANVEKQEGQSYYIDEIFLGGRAVTGVLKAE